MIHFWYAIFFRALHILNFYLPDIQNLAFFKTDDAEISRKYQQKSTWLTGSTCPGPSGNGICMWSPVFDYLLSPQMRDCSGVYCLIFTSHACILNFLIPLWLTGEASAKYHILASPMQPSHYKIIPGWYFRYLRLWIHEKHPIARSPSWWSYDGVSVVDASYQAITTTKLIYLCLYDGSVHTIA